MQFVNVWLVGAGAGDLGLLTLRAYEVIKNSEVVIYDRLVGDSIKSIIPERAEKINVGKTPNKQSITQTEIQDLIIFHAKQNKKVVRLKGGDPFLFGRGGEEAEALIKAGIKFEIVPGVSSALAVPEYAGIPVTHRDYCSGVNIITAHRRNNPEKYQETKIFLMGISEAENLSRKLISSGLDKNTPCAVIENGTTSRQKIVKTTIEKLYSSIKGANIKSPAIIIVGEVAKLNFEWRKNFPLRNYKIALTRPIERSENLARMLRNAGAEVILMPSIRTEIIKNSLDDKNISGYDWIAFTSVTGVEAFFELLRENNRDIREIGGAKIAAIGEATSQAIKKHGLRVDYVPEIYDCENLAKGLLKLGGKILFLRAENGSREIDSIMGLNNVSYGCILLYRLKYLETSFSPEDLDIIIFTSASTVRGFVNRTEKFRNSKVICIGKQTAEEAKRYNFINVTTAKQATEKSIIESVLRVCSQNKF